MVLSKNRKQEEADSEQEVRVEVYKTILSIDEMQDAEVPTQIKADERTPEESIEFAELKAEILESMKKYQNESESLLNISFSKKKNLEKLQRNL